MIDNLPFIEKSFLNIVSGEKEFKCNQCDKSFNQNFNLNRHVRTIHGVQKTVDRRKTIGGERKSAVHLPSRIHSKMKVYLLAELIYIKKKSQVVKREYRDPSDDDEISDDETEAADFKFSKVCSRY